jgi:bacillithiol system protein YtxJ
MSLFKNIFGDSQSQIEKKSKINWIELTNLNQLNEIQANSFQKPYIIFKHSTSCSVSRMALKNFENEFDLQNDLETYFLDLLAFRAISNEIASKFDVVHQSPQLLLIKNGKCIYNVSHSDIDALELNNKI